MFRRHCLRQLGPAGPDVDREAGDRRPGVVAMGGKPGTVGSSPRVV